MSQPDGPPRYSVADGVRDGCALAGTGLLSAGFWMVYQPAGLIAAGAVLLGLAVARLLRR